MSRAKRIPISDKLATDQVGVQRLEELLSLFARQRLTKSQRYLATINVLKALQLDKRLWRIQDGSLVE